MEKIYSSPETQCRLITSRPETVKFLLDYSRSLHMREFKGMTIEQNLN
ncbi:hypothetical protein SAMN06265375_104158 [Muriicola jejuensis]|nr:hypothetical protein [Muriicola jejuensis]SMP24139.1 hypothetical protein SAMN06265375_104158 [Muriicola jejuensis]